jgi:DNA invertase Pin-like site-specific DNA recombinase
MRVAIYSRVSTSKQTVENQLRELREVAKRNGWTVAHELSDEGISGAKGRKERPAFDALHKMIARREIDLVMCWSIDRLGRSITDLVSLMAELEVKGVDFYSHIQAIDSRTPAGRLSFAIFSAIAEFEKSIIRERVVAGLERAKAEGKRLGRPTNVNENTKVAVRLMREKGAPIHRIARELKIGFGTTQKILREAA